MKRKYRKHRGIGVALLAVTAAICISACGGSSNAASTTKSTTAKTSSTASKTSKSNTFTALRACLTKHGVTLPSRAGHRGGGFFGGGTRTTSGGAGTAGTATTPAGGPPTGGPPTGAPGAGGGFAGGANSKFAKAFKACGGKAGGFRGGFGGGYPGAGGAPGAGAGHFRPAFTKATLTAFVACVRKNGYPAMPEAKTNTTTGGFFPLSIEKNAKFQKASVKCAGVLRTPAGAANPGGANQSATTTASSSST